MFFFRSKVPDYATDSYIRGIQLALDCKNLGESVFIKDSVAIAFYYGYRHENIKNAIPPKTVLFIHMGHHSTTCFLVKYQSVFIFAWLSL